MKDELDESIINRQYITIRELAQHIGNVLATFEAALTGPLHYRDMKTSKIIKLKENKKNLMQKPQLARNVKQKLNGG